MGHRPFCFAVGNFPLKDETVGDLLESLVPPAVVPEPPAVPALPPPASVPPPPPLLRRHDRRGHERRDGVRVEEVVLGDGILIEL